MGASRTQSGYPTAAVRTAVSNALRALSICAPMTLLDVQSALAQDFEHASLAVDIPARQLAEALTEFASQTGLQLVYVSDIVRNRRSHAATAGLSVDEALARLLQGTGLRYEYLAPHSIHILAAETAPVAAVTFNSAQEELREIIVTANRREEDQQDVPMTIQVLTGETLATLNTTTFDDFVNYLPGVTAHGVGPGQNTVYVRGLGNTVGGMQGSGVVGTFPNVAVYLDEQSAQLPDRNLDIYAADLDRIEILEGPQGTLFGAGAEAGVVRYITNKPKLDVAEAMVNGGGATTAHGALSGNVEVTANVPLINDRLAVRGVLYEERRGGYIDNVPGTFARTDTDPGWQAYGGPLPANSVVINNAALVARDINPVTYQGIRVEALYQFNADWSALLAQSYQSMEADGVFAEMAANSLGQPLPDLSVQLYNPSYNKDRFENTALTLDGRIGALKLLYTGAYLVRNVEQAQDYTNYTRSLGGDYYSCANPTPTTVQCFSPSATWHDRERNTHQSHELRVSTPGDWRIHGIGGLFYENYRIQEQTDWFYVTALPYYNPIGPPTGYYTLNGSPLLSNGTLVRYNQTGAVFVPSPVTSNNPNIRPPGDGFFDDIGRGYTQRAAYASVDIELIPKMLTLTAGTRYSRTDTSEVGSSVGAAGCYTGADGPPGTGPMAMVPNPCLNHSNFTNINAEGLERNFSGFRSRANLSWKVTEDALLYYTWSQGFRAGGFNRAPFPANNNSPLALGNSPQATEHGGWVSPLAFAPDSLTNNELGWKTMWMDRRVQWNGAIYQENWDHVQIDGGASGILSYGVILNGGNYRVRGVETSGTARVTNGLTLEAGADWNHSELVREATLLWQDGTPIDFSTLHIPNPGGALGSPLAGAPPFKGNIRARYEFAFDGYAPFAQIDAVHQSHSLAETNNLLLDLQGKSTAYDLPAFTTYDGALGVGKDAWLVQVYGENLTDTRAQLYANYWQWYKAITVNRPRTLGLRFSYRFRGS
jgi:iron complex outermembrane recepter protein